MSFFKEQQRFHPIWFFLVIGIILLTSYVFSIVLGNGEINFLYLILENSLAIVIFYFVFIVPKLVTIVNEEMITVKWMILGYTIYEKKIPWLEVVKLDIVKYSFVGYGYRITSKYGIVINARGNHGLRLITSKSKKFVFGTQKPIELTKYINNNNKIVRNEK
nr:hypothetical protein [uncultured Allomuricauda sp.]